jgi:hypothetical protein
MAARPKKWKPKFEKNLIYSDTKRRMAIGYDNLQWILEYKSYYRYYGTMESLVNELSETLVREWVAIDKQTLLEAIRSSKDYIYKLVKDIKLPRNLQEKG